MPIVLKKRIRTERAGGGGNDCDKVTQGGGNSKKLKKITRKVKGKAPKEICWREMTKHQIGKKNGEKSKKTRKRANFSSKPDISVKKPFFSGGKLKTYQCLRVFRLTRHLEQFVAVH